MSDLANNLAHVETLPPSRCDETYPNSDKDDMARVVELKRGRTWDDVQRLVDTALSINTPIANDKFVRHWRGKCACWS